jgi:hypothetical protein
MVGNRLGGQPLLPGSQSPNLTRRWGGMPGVNRRYFGGEGYLQLSVDDAVFKVPAVATVLFLALFLVGVWVLKHANCAWTAAGGCGSPLGGLGPTSRVGLADALVTLSICCLFFRLPQLSPIAAWLGLPGFRGLLRSEES